MSKNVLELSAPIDSLLFEGSRQFGALYKIIGCWYCCTFSIIYLDFLEGVESPPSHSKSWPCKEGCVYFHVNVFYMRIFFESRSVQNTDEPCGVQWFWLIIRDINLDDKWIFEFRIICCFKDDQLKTN